MINWIKKEIGYISLVAFSILVLYFSISSIDTTPQPTPEVTKELECTIIQYDQDGLVLDCYGHVQHIPYEIAHQFTFDVNATSDILLGLDDNNIIRRIKNDSRD